MLAQEGARHCRIAGERVVGTHRREVRVQVGILLQQDVRPAHGADGALGIALLLLGGHVRGDLRPPGRPVRHEGRLRELPQALLQVGHAHRVEDAGGAQEAEVEEDRESQPGAGAVDPLHARVVGGQVGQDLAEAAAALVGVLPQDGVEVVPAVVGAPARVHVGEGEEAVGMARAVGQGLLGGVVVVLFLGGDQRQVHRLLDAVRVHEAQQLLHGQRRVAVDHFAQVSVEVYHPPALRLTLRPRGEPGQ